ncbi:elongation factor Ts [Candidatus Parcubacteria bacterium]|jgi:elongation factor Ts|nr:elongation factor Ts [Candidatus Parcubacteria bacterium]
MINLEQIKQLRMETDVSYTECKKALEETSGDVEKAKEVLRKWGKELAGKKAGREANQGVVESYIHPNKKVGVLVELRCETDFVAKSEQFQKLAHEVCLQIAATKPLFLTEDDIPENFLDKERKIYQEQVKDSGKPEQIIKQIIEGKLAKYKKEVCLVQQPYIRDDSKTIKNLIEEAVAKLGENIRIEGFARREI